MGSSGTSPGWLAAEARLADIISPPNDRKGDNHTGLRWWFCMAANKTTECHESGYGLQLAVITTLLPERYRFAVRIASVLH